MADKSDIGFGNRQASDGNLNKINRSQNVTDSTGTPGSDVKRLFPSSSDNTNVPCRTEQIGHFFV